VPSPDAYRDRVLESVMLTGRPRARGHSDGLGSPRRDLAVARRRRCASLRLVRSRFAVGSIPRPNRICRSVGAGGPTKATGVGKEESSRMARSFSERKQARR
jgi:hypothetical protein